MPPPVGRIRGSLFENADAVYLPRIWPSLREVAMYVDTNTVGINTLLKLAALSERVRKSIAATSASRNVAGQKAWIICRWHRL